MTYDVFQWNVVNMSSAAWSWQSQDSWKVGNTSWAYGYGGGLTGVAELRVPNLLAANLLIADTKTLYSTPSVLTSVETFHHATTVVGDVPGSGEHERDPCRRLDGSDDPRIERGGVPVAIDGQERSLALGR